MSTPDHPKTLEEHYAYKLAYHHFTLLPSNDNDNNETKLNHSPNLLLLKPIAVDFWKAPEHENTWRSRSSHPKECFLDGYDPNRPNESTSVGPVKTQDIIDRVEIPKNYLTPAEFALISQAVSNNEADLLGIHANALALTLIFSFLSPIELWIFHTCSKRIQRYFKDFIFTTPFLSEWVKRLAEFNSAKRFGVKVGRIIQVDEAKIYMQNNQFVKKLNSSSEFFMVLDDTLKRHPMDPTWDIAPIVTCDESAVHTLKYLAIVCAQNPIFVMQVEARLIATFYQGCSAQTSQKIEMLFVGLDSNASSMFAIAYVQMFSVGI